MVKVYHRSRVLGLERIPAGRCLLVGNHSGGLLTPDFAIFAVDYYERFGYDKPLYVLGHDSLFHGPAADLLPHLGVIRASLSVLIPVNMPLPSKIVTQVLDPIDVVGQWGPHPDPVKVDGRVRRVTQAELDRLRRRRCLPIIG